MYLHINNGIYSKPGSLVRGFFGGTLLQSVASLRIYQGILCHEQLHIHVAIGTTSNTSLVTRSFPVSVMILRPSPRSIHEIFQRMSPSSSASQEISAVIQQLKEKYQLPELYSRHFDPPLPHPKRSSPSSLASSNTFRVMQFNLLAEGLSSSPELKSPLPFPELKEKDGDYGGFDLDENRHLIFDFKIRQWRLMEEILRYLPDVLAVEECDRFDDFFFPVLQHLGYSVSSPDSPPLPDLTSHREDSNQRLPLPAFPTVTTVMVLPSSGEMISFMKRNMILLLPLPLLRLLLHTPQPLSQPFSLIDLPTNQSTSWPRI
jgi:hypothetical protein